MLLITLLACMDPKINVHVDITRQKGFGDTGDTALGDELFEVEGEESSDGSQKLDKQLIEAEQNSAENSAKEEELTEDPIHN